MMLQGLSLMLCRLECNTDQGNSSDLAGDSSVWIRQLYIGCKAGSMENNEQNWARLDRVSFAYSLFS